MNVTNFEYMLALAQTGSITKTAGQFFVSPSAISQCLKNEEQQIGQKLFERSNQKMIPTAAGLIYLEGAEKILAIRQTAYERLHIAAKRLRAPLRIAFPSMLSSAISDVIAPALDQSFPDMDLQYICADSLSGIAYLQNNLADFALLAMPARQDPFIHQLPLGTGQLLLVIPKAYLRGKIAGDEPSLEECSSIPFILLKKGTGARECVDRFLNKNHLSLGRIYDVNNHLTALKFLEDGKGAAFLPDILISPDIRQHFFILSLTPPLYFQYALAWPLRNTIGALQPQISQMIAKVWNSGSPAALPE
ncbi:MAG: LysR family transcriptional regulator [Eubacteriales bacterium]|nr:LysR family transcriptional regulator [Eubacteriales bacterium]